MFGSTISYTFKTPTGIGRTSIPRVEDKNTNKILPKFIFPGLTEPQVQRYFGHNILGLVSSLYDAAISRGCMDNWIHGDIEIDICLIHDEHCVPTSDFYIQYQMEQITSANVKSFKAKLSSAYALKLRNALQVWDFSKFNVRLLSDFRMNIVKKDAAYFVPMETLLDVDHFNSELCKRYDRGQRIPFVSEATQEIRQNSPLFPQNFENTLLRDPYHASSTKYVKDCTLLSNMKIQ